MNQRQGFAPIVPILITALLLGGGYFTYKLTTNTKVETGTSDKELNLEQLRNSQITFGSNPVNLTDGSYVTPACLTTPRGEGCLGISYKDGELYRGDINADGNSDVATTLFGYCGGAGVCNTYVAVWLNENGTPKFFDSINVGYRMGVKSIVITDKKISFEVFDIYSTDKSSTKLTYIVSGNKLIKTPKESLPIESSWKTYQNENYGFEFKYPSTLRVKEEAGTVSIYSEKQSLTIRLPIKLSSDTTLEGWILSDKYYPTPVLKEKITLAGEVAHRISISGIEGGTQDIIYTIHKNEGYMIYLASVTEPVFSQILSTFKFTK